MRCSIKKVTMFLALLIALSLGAVPNTINFQGALKDANGMPVNDTQFMEFRIYDAPDAGSLLWIEQHLSVEISDGIFSEELGDVTAFPEDLFDNSDLYITFFFGGEEMSPRQRILAVPYAIQAENAEHADESDNANLIDNVNITGLVQQDVSGNAAISGTMTAAAFAGDGTGLTGITSLYDSLYIHKIGPDTMTANATVGVLNIENTNNQGKGIKILDAGDDGIEIVNVGDNGIEITQAANKGIHIDSSSNDGVYISQVGYTISQYASDEHNGFEVAGTEGHGFYAGQTLNDGVHIYNAGYPSSHLESSSINGLEVAGAEGHGLYIGQADLDGVSINKTGNPLGTFSCGELFKNGFEVAGAEGFGLYVGRADIDGVHVYSAGGDGVYVGQADEYGVKVASAGYDGVYVNSAGGDGFEVSFAGDDGVKVFNAGNPSTQHQSSSKNGFEVAGAQGYGLYVGHADESGVYVKTTGFSGFSVDSAVYGVSVYDAEQHGVHILSAGYDGVNVLYAGSPSTSYSSNSHNGVEVSGAEGNGLYVGRADLDGVVVVSAGDDGVSVSGGDDGVYASTTNVSNEFGIFTPDKIYAGAGYYPARSGTFGRNTDSSTLESGDLVCISGGYEENVLGEVGVPVVKIEKANSRNSEAIFGVVEYKVYIREEVEDFEDGKTVIQKSFRFAEGDVMSGDYLAIIVFGPVDVKVDSRGDIKSGQMLTTGDGLARTVKTTEINGILLAENVGILGKALEDTKGKDKIKVFVNCK